MKILAKDGKAIKLNGGVILSKDSTATKVVSATYISDFLPSNTTEIQLDSSKDYFISSIPSYKPIAYITNNEFTFNELSSAKGDQLIISNNALYYKENPMGIGRGLQVIIWSLIKE